MTFVFDAYGTLWDITRIESALADVLGVAESGAILGRWRQKQLEYAFLRTLMDRYEPFSVVTEQALRYALQESGIAVPNHQVEALTAAWERPTPFDDAAQLLAALTGNQRAILSNGDPGMLAAGLDYSGMADLLDAVVSVDAVKRYKPHPAAYQLAMDALGVRRDEVIFVSSNGWDVAGAAHFGFRVVWVNRRGLPVEELTVRPWRMVSSLQEIADIRES